MEFSCFAYIAEDKIRLSLETTTSTQSSIKFQLLGKTQPISLHLKYIVEKIIAQCIQLGHRNAILCRRLTCCCPSPIPNQPTYHYSGFLDFSIPADHQFHPNQNPGSLLTEQTGPIQAKVIVAAFHLNRALVVVNKSIRDST